MYMYIVYNYLNICLCHQQYILERESIPLVAQPCEKYLSWEDGEKYILDQKVMHKATSTLIMWIVEYRKISRMAQLERDVLYRLCKDSDFCRLWLALLVMLYKMKSSSCSWLPDSFATFWREATNPNSTLGVTYELYMYIFSCIILGGDWLIYVYGPYLNVCPGYIMFCRSSLGFVSPYMYMYILYLVFHEVRSHQHFWLQNYCFLNGNKITQSFSN